MSDAAIDAARHGGARRRRRRGAPCRSPSARRRSGAFLDALLAMNQEVVPEIAQQMGRPVRYGGEFRGVEERARHMMRIAEESLRADSGREREGRASAA